jgi:hypothetical protein
VKYSIVVKSQSRFEWQGVRYLKEVSSYSKAGENLDKLVPFVDGSVVVLQGSCPILRAEIQSGKIVSTIFCGDNRTDAELEFDLATEARRKLKKGWKVSGDSLASFVMAEHRDSGFIPKKNKMRCRNKGGARV